MKTLLGILLGTLLTNIANADTVINTKDGLIGSNGTITVNGVDTVIDARNKCEHVLRDTHYKCGILVTFVIQSKGNEDYAIFKLIR
jgi:hypothetical protein